MGLSLQIIGSLLDAFGLKLKPGKTGAKTEAAVCRNDSAAHEAYDREEKTHGWIGAAAMTRYCTVGGMVGTSSMISISTLQAGHLAQAAKKNLEADLAPGQFQNLAALWAP